MSYSLAVEKLYALGHELAPTKPGAPRRKFDLDHMRILAAALGNQHQQIRPVLIAGTNGKGSTASTLASIGTASGYRTGLYTSPHLERINERIQIDGQPISDDDFARLYFHVDNIATQLVREAKLPYAPSFFEVITAIGFQYFAEQKVDLAVLEVGLGGRLDATNIVAPMLSIITDIGLDHTEWLGPTLTHIAREKAGILRADGVLVTLSQHQEVNTAIGEVAVSLNVRGVNAAEYIPDRALAPSTNFRNQYSLKVLGESIAINSPLSGQHQQRNLALAIAAAVELKENHGYSGITAASIAQGVTSTRWPGRLELIATKHAPVLLDVAHNPDGAWTLRAVLAHLPESQPRTLIFSCLRDKALSEISRTLFPLFDSSADRPQDHILLLPINNPRASSLEDLKAATDALDIPATTFNSPEEALAEAFRITPTHGLIIATGSVYLVGEIRSALKTVTHNEDL